MPQAAAAPRHRGVRFPTYDPASVTEITDGVAGRRIEGRGELVLPAHGVESGATVIIAQGLSGPDQAREFAYARRLAARGHKAIVLDSFGARGVGWLNDNLRALRLSSAAMLCDLFGALRYAVDELGASPDRVVVQGFSYGAMVSVMAAYEHIAARLEPGGLRFAGHVAYYPCSIPRLDDPRTTGAPLLMMLGEKDNNISIERTELIANDLRRGGSEVDLRVFEGAYHAWDGSHREPYSVWASLRDCAIRIDRDGNTRDETTGRLLGRLFDQTLYLARHTNWSGYTMLRDERTAKISDDALFRFVARIAAQGEEMRSAVA